MNMGDKLSAVYYELKIVNSEQRPMIFFFIQILVFYFGTNIFFMVIIAYIYEETVLNTKIQSYDISIWNALLFCRIKLDKSDDKNY